MYDGGSYLGAVQVTDEKAYVLCICRLTYLLIPEINSANLENFTCFVTHTLYHSSEYRYVEKL